MSVNGEFEKTKAFLKTADGNGASLYDHLTSVLLEVATKKPDNALELFEQISHTLKAGSLKPELYKELAPEESESKVRANLVASIERLTTLAKAKSNEEEDEETVIPDLFANAELFEWAGINMGKEETYKLLLSITELVRDQINKDAPIKSIRFWGKVFGLKADYLIIEAQFQEWPDEELPETSKQEPAGEGANEYVYFATNSPESKWTELKSVTPEQIQTAKKMRRFFTGELKAQVLGFPRFPWGEAAYLRAQIARITAATTISPAGFYIQDEEDDDENAIVEDPEFAPLAPRELKDFANWKHHRQYLMNSQGRVTAFVPPEADDEDEEVAKDEEEEEEDIPERLASLEDDVVDGKRVWSLRISPNKNNPHAVVSAHSLSWPGAVAVGKKSTWANIYVGYGQKYLPGLFTPPAPPAVQSEFVAEFDPEEDEADPLAEQADPTPKAVKPNDGDGEEEDEEADEEDDE